MSHKSSAAVYAQMRRDIETSNREALKDVIPQEYLTAEIEEDGTLNPTAKVMLAARNLIHNLQMHHCVPINEAANEEDMIFLIPLELKKEQSEELRQLRQVAQRLVHKVEESVQSSQKITKRMQILLVKASDTLIDLIDEVEKVTLKR